MIRSSNILFPLTIYYFEYTLEVCAVLFGDLWFPLQYCSSLQPTVISPTDQLLYHSVGTFRISILTITFDGYFSYNNID